MARRYFEEEMRYLHEAGKVYAETHPEQARFLNIDSISDRDPYVERLFEGFAFLTGRIREQLDDELPQYTEGLCNLLFPHFLKPVPALSLVEFQPKSGEVQGTTTLKRGTEVRSGPVGEEKAVCRFVTTQEVKLQPLRVRNVEMNWTPEGTSSVAINFGLEGGVEYSSLNLSPLRLHFVADPSIASQMHLYFTRHVRKVTISSVMHGIVSELTEDEAVTLMGQEWVKPGGIVDKEGLLPYSQHSFAGFRLLQEYMSFRPKFWCIDLFGLGRFRPTMMTGEFKVEVFFDDSYPEDKRFRTENIRLFVAPVVNIFEMDAEPIRIDHQTAEYRVIPSARFRKSIHVYNIDKGVSMEERTGKRHEYTPFFSFRHKDQDENRYFTTSSRIGPTELYESSIFLDSALQEDGALVKESLSLDLRCTNGSLPREHLRERMINQLAPDVPKVAQPNNITQPTLILYPPTKQRKEFFWQMISHWSFNFRTVANTEALAGLLSLYDWTNENANRRRIAGIREVNWAPKEMMHRGAILRGTEVTIQIQEGHFADEGDVGLFGLVMSHFLSMYATLNSFVHLTIEMIPSGKTYKWQPKAGTRTLL